MVNQPPLTPPPGSAGAVLAAARAARATEYAAAAELLACAVEWAAIHEPIEDHTPVAAWWIHGTFVPLAGPGTPQIAQDAVAEFAAVIGISTMAGRTLIGHALELAYRLPKLWQAVQTGTVPAWRARQVAEATTCVSKKAAGFIDRQVACVAGRISKTQLDRLVTEARIRAGEDTEVEVEGEEFSPDTRHTTLYTDQISFNGTVQLAAELDLADALDLDKALALSAEQLKLAGSTDPLDTRRATSLGQIARNQLTLTYPTHHTEESQDHQTATAAVARPSKPVRPVTLFLHLSHQALTGTGTEVGRCENTATPIHPETIRAWCANPDIALTITPILDLTAHLRTDAYELPDRLQTQIDQRDAHCVFPYCTRPATRCDHDHVIAWNQGGTTCSCNTGPLCRHHHRLKTHTPWTLKMIEPGLYTWRSPHGYQFLRDPTGTRDITPPDLTPTPACLAPPSH